jgi:serine/threonine protein phosphatase PrpC
VYKATYAANDPSEDRCNLAVDLDGGKGSLFAGVWDGHGGAQCSDYIEGPQGIWPEYARQLAGGASAVSAFTRAYAAVDNEYNAHGNALISKGQELQKEAQASDDVGERGKLLAYAHESFRNGVSTLLAGR